MGTAQVEFTEEELLADVPVAEPLIAGGVRCHGGFDEDGRYVSPRTKFRVPAISAWGEQNSARFCQRADRRARSNGGSARSPTSSRPASSIRAGVPEPLMATLTRIGTVEGYGANIRLLQPKDLQRHFVEDIEGTAIDHLGRGLFEAHGRDEAGWDEEAGSQGHVVRRPRHRLRAVVRGARHRGDVGPDGIRRRAARAPTPPVCCPTTSPTSSR